MSLIPQNYVWITALYISDYIFQASSIHTAYKRRTVWNYKNANFFMFRTRLINVVWNTIFTAEDINEMTIL